MSHQSTKAPVTGSAVFETALGWMGIAWSEEGLARLQLPESDRAGTERRLARTSNGVSVSEPPPKMALLIDKLRDYAAGQQISFDDFPVDLSGIDAFRLAIYDATRKLKYGETLTYGELASRAGHAGLFRETGQALGSNPVPIVVPCHRILAAGNLIGGFSAPGGSTTKERLLVMEGVRIGPPPSPQASFAF
jgi:methylated-DNA-[protein]-cysteine S-methyltransferase